jgi:hypothetical protein
MGGNTKGKRENGRPRVSPSGMALKIKREVDK